MGEYRVFHIKAEDVRNYKSSGEYRIETEVGERFINIPGKFNKLRIIGVGVSKKEVDVKSNHLKSLSIHQLLSRGANGNLYDVTIEESSLIVFKTSVTPPGSMIGLEHIARGYSISDLNLIVWADVDVKIEPHKGGKGEYKDVKRRLTLTKLLKRLIKEYTSTR